MLHRASTSTITSKNTRKLPSLIMWSALTSLSIAAPSAVAAENCNPLSLTTCSLPFPSDHWSVADSNSQSGRLIQFADAPIDQQILAQLPPSLNLAQVYNQSSGFSAATAVLFELSEAPAPETITTENESSVLAFNMLSSEPIPITAVLNGYASSAKVDTPSQVIEITPKARWAFAQPHLVAITKDIRAEHGGELQRSVGFQNALDDFNNDRANSLTDTFEFLAQQGVDVNNLLSLTKFTTRTENEATDHMKHMMTSTYAQPHPIKDIKVSYRLFGSVGAVIRGKVLLSDFRDNNDVMDYSLSEGHDNWVDFRLSMPKAAKGSSVPIAIYGHGITAMKETNFLVSVTNAQKGIATVAIDHPYHGSRILPDGGYVLTMLAPKYLPQQISMMIQSSVDHMGLLKALETSFTDLDVYPKQPFSGLFRHIKNGDGIPDLDTSRVLYQGTSLGGVLGSTFLSLAPTIEDAFLHVAGVGITSILSKSMLWDLAFYRLIPDGVSGGEALVLKAAMQQALDYGDAINFVQYFRNPPSPDITEKRLVVAMGVDDYVVPNEATLALGLIADLPLTGDILKPMPELQQSDEFIDGSGILQFYAPIRVGGKLEDTLAHVSFLRPEVATEMNKWLDDYFLAN